MSNKYNRKFFVYLGRDTTPADEMTYHEYLKSVYWDLRSGAMIERADGKCQRCGYQIVRNLEVHHKNYNNLGREKPEDLEVLCRSCHSKRHGK